MKRLIKRTRIVMTENKNPEYDELTNDKFLEDHVYEGISELDNDLPTWYRFFFYVTILIAVAYLLRFHVYKTAPLQLEEYNNEFAVLELEDENSSDSVSIQLALAEENKGPGLAEGKKIFARSCAVCHLSKGEGLVGPNLTDEYWTHGGSIDDLILVINEGVPEKGMVSWKNQLTQSNINNVAHYILSLQGTNPPNAKAPQGDKYTPGS
jgi:cytochrome c oxidase cbb3-type subunit 3